MMQIRQGIKVKQVGGIGARYAQRNKKRLPKTSFSDPRARFDAAQTPFFVQKHED
jgi:hypothetical protein